ncbi:HAD-IA family hydrolase [Streptomyces sp. JJ66]|uniref:HAD-IA family hydrolase n=1 Tax=Streptomyces sp. JJ66 TaxID=2803843 RepID=UPI001C585187|nr:HAD-IA family hydrolase [Streptomyces sp. JJ66]MBW1603455.1 HAD-IA family hydrolase [Streptomyces sp. JJ66]
MADTTPAAVPADVTTLTARALLLDMDGTLVDSDAVVDRVWTDWALEHGLDPRAVLPIVPGRQGHEPMAELLPHRPMAENHADNRRMLERETAETDGIVPVPGAAAFLAAIADAPHALVTSADSALARARMDAAGLRMPHTRVTAEMVSASKPDPEGFRTAAAHLGVEPADCVVFEDSEAGVAAGRAAGMRVVGVGPRAAAFAPTAHVPTLEHLRTELLPDGTIRLTLLPPA